MIRWHTGLHLLNAHATALGVLAAGALFAAMGGSYPKVGATCGLIYLLGLIAIWWAPDTSGKKLDV